MEFVALTLVFADCLIQPLPQGTIACERRLGRAHPEHVYRGVLGREGLLQRLHSAHMEPRVTGWRCWAKAAFMLANKSAKAPLRAP